MANTLTYPQIRHRRQLHDLARLGALPGGRLHSPVSSQSDGIFSGDAAAHVAQPFDHRDGGGGGSCTVLEAEGDAVLH